MTSTQTLKSSLAPRFQVTVNPDGAERRAHRRHDMESLGIAVERWEGVSRGARPLGTLVDLSAGGLRMRMPKTNIRPEQQIRVRIELPVYAGICPFIQSSDEGLKPRKEWIGWMSVARVVEIDEDHMEVAGRLVDMDEIDRGMLGLYLSTQPLAA